ncbi:alpha/beta hydrolase [Priestia koreensis]|uniref:Lipase n=1 Tax=Priestia koreensis TaxID=284581 RepID=A0A0M0L9G2_9BACI|nr:alpha/beta fold hydrolase [Priestia koreensis]KOO47482.1 lipase [Priestia koreensis]
MKQYDVLEGAEPFIYEGNNVGILVSHGFTGSTQSMKPLGDAYHAAGYTVYGPRLKGHGTHYEDMEQTTYQDWIDSVEEGIAWLKERCETIFVTGLSMGGTLTLYLAEKHPEIKGIIPINAAIDIPAMEGAKDQQEPRFFDAIGSDIKKEGVEELAYDKTPLKSMKEIIKLMALVKDDLSKVTCPALIFMSEEDHVVPPLNSTYILENISSQEKEVISMPNSYHVATLDHDQHLIIEESLKFFQTQLEK